MTHSEYAEALRTIADWWEQHPELNLPYELNPFRYVAISREEMVGVAKALGTCEKDYDSGMFYLRKQFGPAQFEAFCRREKVCNKKVVGTRQVEERVIPAHIEEIVEWECFETPLLTEGNGEAPAVGGGE